MNEYIVKSNPQKQWVGPREKLEQHGVNFLSNAELLAVIFGTGSRSESVLTMTERIIRDYGNTGLVAATKLTTVTEQFSLPRVKSMQLLATLELGRRFFKPSKEGRPVLNNPEKISKRYEIMGMLQREELRAIYLNIRKELVGTELISIGSISHIHTEKRDILAPALEHSAVALVLLHNHPGGNSSPSEQDITFTAELVKACKLLGLEFLDHLIIAGNGYFSFHSAGLLPVPDT